MDLWVVNDTIRRSRMRNVPGPSAVRGAGSGGVSTLGQVLAKRGYRLSEWNRVRGGRGCSPPRADRARSPRLPKWPWHGASARSARTTKTPGTSASNDASPEVCLVSFALLDRGRRSSRHEQKHISGASMGRTSSSGAPLALPMISSISAVPGRNRPTFALYATSGKL
jgi:hypothetical protein